MANNEYNQWLFSLSSIIIGNDEYNEWLFSLVVLIYIISVRFQIVNNKNIQ